MKQPFIVRIQPGQLPLLRRITHLLESIAGNLMAAAAPNFETERQDFSGLREAERGAPKFANPKARLYWAIHMPKWKVVLPTGLLWLAALLWGFCFLFELSAVSMKPLPLLPAAKNPQPVKSTVFTMAAPLGCARSWEAEHVGN
jgi:hypothetical protein